MSTYTATVAWQCDDQGFTANTYSRAHEWRFDGGLVVPASSSPHIVPIPLSNASNVDPEEAFVAALSSCHMLFFLALAASAGIVVDAYVDHAIGQLRKDAAGRLAMTRVVLRPAARYGGHAEPDRSQIDALHHAAHEKCFIANSVTTEVVVETVS